jgi:hypothetical protein
MKKQWVLYLLAIVITLSAAVYQRLTGPTHPRRVTVNFKGKEYPAKLLRSSNNDHDAEIILPGEIPESADLLLEWRHYPSDEEWREVKFVRNSNGWTVELPRQPAAGKLEYYIKYFDGAKEMKIPDDAAVVIRYKGPVPNWVLVPHVLFMFLAMYFSNLMGLESLVNNERYFRHALYTALTLGIGGFILGPLMQLYAFGDLWTGVPFGWDLTDNKTLIAGLALALGIWQNRRTGNLRWILFASIVIFAIYLIPHSALGSQLDYKTGQVMTG